jgi:hypothetical protein
MFLFDVETLGKRSNSVILSMAAIYFDPDTKPSPEQLREDVFFAKFSVIEQVKEYGREMNQSTMDWWKKQCHNVRVASFLPSEVDCSFVDGYESMRKWAASKNDTKCWVWARGNLDQLVMDDIEEQLELEPIWPYARWRDVRTAVDFLYNTTNGYVDVDYPGFDSRNHITKHNPIDDCVLDAMMMMYGVKHE